MEILRNYLIAKPLDYTAAILIEKETLKRECRMNVFCHGSRLCDREDDSEAGIDNEIRNRTAGFITL